MPYLVEVATALLPSKPESSGLECDFGSFSDIITPKRSLVGGRFAKALMVLKLNKHLMPYNPKVLILLDNSDRENRIPKHHIFNEEL
jgi:hypothetical protein